MISPPFTVTYCPGMLSISARIGTVSQLNDLIAAVKTFAPLLAETGEPEKPGPINIPETTDGRVEHMNYAASPDCLTPDFRFHCPPGICRNRHCRHWVAKKKDAAERREACNE